VIWASRSPLDWRHSIAMHYDAAMSKPASNGPLAGESLPQHGGQPDLRGCNGCTDCCHLPEIAVTDEEAAELRTLHAAFPQHLKALIMVPDTAHAGWQMMQGPCVFRQVDTPLTAGGCRIHDHRPSSCAIFSCRLLLDLKRANSV